MIKNKRLFMDKISFEQLPQAVSVLIEKVGILTSKLDALLVKTRQQEESRRLLALDDVATLLGKSASTIYAMTSEKRIPFHKRGNKLYFFESEIMEWIEQGGTSGTANGEDFNKRLETLRNSKRRKPRSMQEEKI